MSLDRIWDHLERPYVASEVANALVGLHPAAARQLVGLQLLTSPEAEHLLDRMHEIVRSLAVNTTSAPIRCTGEIRGPVLWSATAAARSASPGAHDVFICSSTIKAYDTGENRVLLWVLSGLADVVTDAAGPGLAQPDPQLVRRAHHNGTRANRYIEHQALSGVKRMRPTGRDIQKARSGTRSPVFRRAVQLIAKLAEPIGPVDLARFCDGRTIAQHTVLAALIDGFAKAGSPLPRFRIERGVLRAGPVRYLHPRRVGAHATVHGIAVGDLLIDVPDRPDETDYIAAEAALSARAAGHPVLPILKMTDAERVVQLTLAKNN